MQIVLATILFLQFVLVPPVKYGGYHWGSNYQGQVESGKDRLTWGVDQNIGEVIRVYAGYHTVTSYQIEPPPIEGQSDYLLKILQTPAFVSLLSNSRFHTIMLTCYTYEEFIYSRHWDQLNFERVREEYRNAALWLGQFPSKRIIILPWEGDNEVDGVHELLPFYAQQMAAKISGIASAAQPNVFSAMEINDVNGVVLPLVPILRPDYVSYSSWRTINRVLTATDPNELYNALRADIQIIKEIIGTYYDPARLLIGEFGRHPLCQIDPAQWFRVFDKAIRFEGIVYAVYWQITSDTSGVTCLYDDNGDRTMMGDLMFQFTRPIIIVPPKKWKPIYDVPLPFRSKFDARYAHWNVPLSEVWGDGGSWHSPSPMGLTR